MFRTPFTVDYNTQMLKSHRNLNHQKCPSPRDLDSNCDLNLYTLKTIFISNHKSALLLSYRFACESWPQGCLRMVWDTNNINKLF